MLHICYTSVMQLQIRATQEDVEQWDRAAKAQGRSRSAWIRRVLDEAAARPQEALDPKVALEKVKPKVVSVPGVVRASEVSAPKPPTGSHCPDHPNLYVSFGQATCRFRGCGKRLVR